MKQLVFAMIAILAAAGAEANAVLFENPSPNVNGNCVFNTNCGPAAVGHTVWAAQLFSLAVPATVTGGSFTDYKNFGSTQPTAANWMILAANGSGGLPGTLLKSGFGASITNSVSIGSNFGLDLVKDYFSIGPLDLLAGTYFFAVQAVSSEFPVYLSSGTLVGGAAQSTDGVNWSADYSPSSFNSIAVGLYGNSIPEPGTAVLLGVGVAGWLASRRGNLSRRTG